MQETFISALNSQKDHADISSFKNWLIGILKHKIMDYFRKIHQEKQLQINPEQDQTFSEHFFNAHEHWSPKPKIWWNPRQALEEKEFWARLNECLSSMPSHMSNAFKLRVLNEQKTQDVQTTMNVTETNLGVILYRARLLLRQCLENNWFQRKK